MKRNNRRINLRISMCLAILSVAASLIGSARSPSSGQASLVRVVSPADFVLQPSDPVAGTVKTDFAFDPRVSYVMLYTAAPGGAMDPATMGSAGGSQPHDNMIPFLVINFILSLFGIFPSQT